MSEQYSLSVVQLCPAEQRDTANRCAELYGYGPDNLSRELRHADGSTWWGCHAWWMPAALANAATVPVDPETEAPLEGGAEALGVVITSVVDGGNPLEHWQSALAANNLVAVGG